MKHVLVVVLALALVACSKSSPTAPTPAPTPTPAPAPTPAPTPTPAPPPGPSTQFGPGQHRVGTGIAAGRYYSDPVSGCYWERQSGFGGTLNDIITNEFVSFNARQWIVDILTTDVGFETDSECGTWYSTPRQPAQTTIRGGVWLVNGQIQPGQYQTNALSGCYWERVRNFENTIAAIIANDFVSGGGQQIVQIGSSDVGFRTDDECGAWTAVNTSAVTSSMQSTTDIASAREQARIRRGLY